MKLLDVPLKISYRTGRDDLVGDFFVPCLEASDLYCRAAGYFTSHGLALAARGVAHLASRRGKMRLVASPHLEQEDVAALQRASEHPPNLIRSVVSKSLVEIEDALLRDRLNALAWLAAERLLEVRLALRVDDEGRIRKGIYHEKTGVFSDDAGNVVAFSGSSNETAGGLFENFENIDVYLSWKDHDGRVAEKIQNFEDLWEDRTQGLRVIDFTEASAELLESFRDPSRPPAGLIGPLPRRVGAKNTFALPRNLKLRDYQEAAIQNWFKANGRGVFKMATGSGKTITSLATAAKLHEKMGLECLIVVCPYRHLVTQWSEELERFGVTPILAFESRQRWLEALNSRLALQHSDARELFVVITTNTTFSTELFQSRLSLLPGKTMLIADEVHNFGARNLRTRTPESVRFRLGLSATPERYQDPDGTDAIFAYFGDVLKPEFSLKDALDAGALTPYRYYPILVELTEDESDLYYDLSQKISKLAAMNSDALDSESENPALEALLYRRARLVACAENKLTALRELMRTRKDDCQMLFYCGDGRVEFDADAELVRHVEAVSQILGSELGIKVAKFLGETSIDERENLKRRLTSGALQGLVAIRCLDEGVDIPSIRTAVILASSSNPRQFIQRRGRILRRDPASGKRFAEIYDMIVVPPPDSEIVECERSMLKKELKRFVEFASLALNSGEARATILGIQKQFHLLDI